MRFAGTYKGRHLKRIVSLVEAYLARLIWWNVSVDLKIIIFNEMWIITNIKSIFNFPSTLNWELFTLKLVPSIGSPPPFILWLIVIKPSMTSILFQLQIRTKIYFDITKSDWCISNKIMKRNLFWCHKLVFNSTTRLCTV